VFTPGQTLPVRLRFIPSQDVNLEGARLKLEGVEHVTSGSGTNSRSYSHTVWTQDIPLIEARPLMRGQPVDVVAQVELPQTGAFSLDAPSNKLTWSASVRVDVPGWADWVRDHEVLMIPAR